MFKRVSNIGIVVKDAATTADNYMKFFGLEKYWDRHLPEAGAERDILLRIPGGSKDATFEILQPVESSESPMRRFLDKRGEGLFHITMVVDDVGEAAKELEAKGVSVWKEVTDAENNFETAFVNPKFTSGVSFEMVTEKMVSTWLSMYG